MLAPIAFFVHSRPEHAARTIASLQANQFADQSTLYIFSDGARTHKQGEAESVAKVRQYIAGIEGFASMVIVERDGNWGLRRNIVEGLNFVLKKHDRVIVVEDDCVATPDFLCYMNDCLVKYQGDGSVWHVSGWGPAIRLPGVVYKSNFMSCWGWATWKDRWCHLSLDAAQLMSQMGYREKYKFNIGGSYPFYSHLVGNYLGKNNTWAIFWAATIFNGGGWCIGPVRSKIKNIGMDDSGTHKAVLFEQDSCGYSPEVISNEVVAPSLANEIIGAALRKNLSFTQVVSMHVKMLMPIWFYRCLRKFKNKTHG